MSTKKILPVALVALVSTFRLVGTAADWPQWRGPQRTGISTETGLLQRLALRVRAIILAALVTLTGACTAWASEEVEPSAFLRRS